jgi:hypothetical protein
MEETKCVTGSSGVAKEGGEKKEEKLTIMSTKANENETLRPRTPIIMTNYQKRENVAPVKKAHDV